MMSLGAVLLVACTGDEAAETVRIDAGRCVDASSISTTVTVATQRTITSDLVVYGTLHVPATVSALRVYVGVRKPPMSGAEATLPAPTIAAVSDAGRYATWHATIPLAVLLAPLEILPGRVEVVALPELNCATDPTTTEPHSIATSDPFTVDRPPGM
jgi:hypothetical protein